MFYGVALSLCDILYYFRYAVNTKSSLSAVTCPIIIEYMRSDDPVRHPCRFQVRLQRRNRGAGAEKQGIAHITGAVDYGSGGVPAGLGDDIGNVIVLLRLKDQVKTPGTRRLKLPGLA